MVLACHELQSLAGVLVVERHGLVVGDVHAVGEALVELYEAHYAVVDERHELGAYALAHQRLLLYLQ